MVTTSIASNEQWPVAAAGNSAVAVEARPADRTRPLRRLRGLLEDAVLLMLFVLLFPLIILLIGTPIALFVRILVEIARR